MNLTTEVGGDRFPDEVSKALGNYVYRLIDPRNGETFYVGKGSGNRVFQHAAGISNKELDEDNGISPKYDRILAILNARLEVIHVIHRHEIPEAAIFDVEAALIDAYPGLTNLQGGHGSNSKGPMNHLQILRKYALPVLEDSPPHKLVLFNINILEDRKGDHHTPEVIYDQVRLAWRINIEKARQADYVLAVVRGVVVGAYRPTEWLPVNRDNFPEVALERTGMTTRYGFKGAAASPDIWDRYVGESGKRIVNERMKHIQNPVRYWNL
jgi:hypothetical protein